MFELFKQRPSPKNTVPESVPSPVESSESEKRKAFEDASLRQRNIILEINGILATAEDKGNPDKIKEAHIELNRQIRLLGKASEDTQNAQKAWFDSMNQ